MSEMNVIKLTRRILRKVAVVDIVYAEIASEGAMGNDGRIILYVLKNELLTRYETNIFEDKKNYERALKLLIKKQKGPIIDYSQTDPNLFEYQYGGVGNHVFINKNVTLIDQGSYFTFNRNDKEYSIFCSVTGVYNCVSYALNPSKDS
ncbi:MAG: hypothetical protein AAF611_16940 [Bacteroidota bacterium]